jgi:hypothetical protein
MKSVIKYSAHFLKLFRGEEFDVVFSEEVHKLIEAYLLFMM